MSDDSWTKNPALSGIDPAKLQMLLTLADQAKGKKQSELLPFLMSTAAQAKSNNMGFQPSETDAIISVLKLGKSPEEIERIDKICSIMKQYRKPGTP